MIRLAIQRTLERGTVPNTATAMLARLWEAHAQVIRPLESRLPTLCISGATLGGSGKTPLAIACARFLAREGLRVALVGHAYRAHPPRNAHRVTTSDNVNRVGDEAIECARALDGENVTVLVARSRQTAVDAAHDVADVIVLDGPLQLSSRRASESARAGGAGRASESARAGGAGRATLALLAVDPTEPWGSGACPPLGNLRARKNVLLSAADLVVPVAPTSRGAWLDDKLIHMSELRRMHVGLTTGIARPDRVVAMMAAHGVRLDPVLCAADHARAPRPSACPDLWVTTPKDSARRRDLAVIDYHLVVPSAVEAVLRSRFLVHF